MLLACPAHACGRGVWFKSRHGCRSWGSLASSVPACPWHGLHFAQPSGPLAAPGAGAAGARVGRAEAGEAPASETGRRRVGLSWAAAVGEAWEAPGPLGAVSSLTAPAGEAPHVLGAGRQEETEPPECRGPRCVFSSALTKIFFLIQATKSFLRSFKFYLLPSDETVHPGAQDTQQELRLLG